MDDELMKHKHHIIPKHMGGTDDPCNLIELTVEEHAEAHRILFETYGRKEDELAWKGLAGIIGKEELTHELSRLGGLKSKSLKGKDHPYYGKKRPEHSAKLKGRKINRTEEHQSKLNKRFTKDYLRNVTNSISRDWKITTPDNEILIVHNMAEFCRKNNLNRGCMSVSSKNKKPHKGYFCEKLG
jgi:hypothetical protein